MGGINRKLHVGGTTMINYLSSFTNTDGASFPDTAFINATGPSATDGTEFVKLFGDDLWGARQAGMNYAGLVPDGVTEADGTAQFIEMLQKGFGAPPGAIMEWANALDPATTGHRAILMQGQGVLRASFPDLDTAVYVGDGNNAAVEAGGGKFYRADNANGTSPNIAGIYLILPDARGVVARGLDTAAAIDPDGASRFLGDVQVDAMQRITGNAVSAPNAGFFNSATGINSGVFVKGSVTTSTLNATVIAGNELDFDSSQSVAPNAAKTDDIETRMHNRSTNFVIWY